MAIIIHISIIVCIYFILASSLNLLVGYAGLLNFGHVAFFGIGAYVSALLTLAGLPYLVAAFAAGLAASILGAILMIITNKLKGEYLALATLGFAFIFSSVLINWESVTRGPLGIPGIPKPSIFGWHIISNASYLLFAAGVAAFGILFIYRIASSRYGRLLEAVRDDAVGCASLGKNIFKLKYQCMMAATFFMGIAGSLYAHYVTYIDPSTFMLSEVVLLFTIIIVGGLRSLPGSLVATVIIVVLPELLRFVDVPPSIVGPARQIFYSVILLGIILWRPRGLFGTVELE